MKNLCNKKSINILNHLLSKSQCDFRQGLSAQNCLLVIFEKLRKVRDNNSAANQGRSTVNCRQPLAFDRPYFSCNDHCDQCLFQKIFN